jgi:hypothetical protein
LLCSNTDEKGWNGPHTVRGGSACNAEGNVLAVGAADFEAERHV